MPLSVWKSDEPDFRRRLSELVGKLSLEPVSYTHLTLPTSDLV